MPFTFKRDRLRDIVAANVRMLDFYGMASDKTPLEHGVPLPKQRTPKEKPLIPPDTEPRERANLRTIIDLLRTHPKVAFAWRMQSGLFSNGQRTIKIGVVGIPDIIGMLKSGRFYGIEVKAARGKVSDLQQKRLDQINRDGGLAFVAYGVNDVLAALDHV